MSREIERLIDLPFWIDTVGRSDFIEVRIDMGDADAARGRASQPGLRLQHPYFHRLDGRDLGGADRRSPSCSCATRSGRSWRWPTRRRNSARAARSSSARAARARCGAPTYAFLEMKRRIERAMEQRTTMLNGVSHDLRTILTRFKLSLALLGDEAEVEELAGDVDEMQRMLEAYLAFARGDIGEAASPTDIPRLARNAAPGIRATWPRNRSRLCRRAGRHGAAGRLQALPRQSAQQRRAPRRQDPPGRLVRRRNS